MNNHSYINNNNQFQIKSLINYKFSNKKNRNNKLRTQKLNTFKSEIN